MTNLKDVKHDDVTSLMNAICAVVHAVIVVAKAVDQFGTPTNSIK